MFSVKATYNGEIRKFTLPESSFPSFESIQSQLYRVFPIRGSYHLSRLMFCPAEGSRVVVGKEAHNEEQYNEHIAPFSGRFWPNGLLRFNVVDDISHKLPFTASVEQAPSEFSSSTRVARPLPCHPHAAASSTSMEVDDEWTATAASNRLSVFSQSTQQSCCSVAEGKEEMKDLMSNFLRDFNNVMSSTFGEVPAAPHPAPAPASASSSETIAPEQKNVDDTSDVTIPGAFVHPAPPSTSTPATSEERALHYGISCDYCGNDVRGTRFKCQNCLDYDLCEECVSILDAKGAHQASMLVEGGGPPHTFLEIAKPGGHLTSAASEDTENSCDLMIPPLLTPAVHVGVVCDFCGDTVVGNRHKCLDCQDFDLCDACYPRAKSDHSGHEFVTIKTPGRIVIHRVRDGAATPRFDRPSSPANVSSAVVHHANCDLCDSRIRGARYKCLSCPDYDTCASCHSIVPEHHPKHTFVKLESPQDLSPRDPSAFRKHNARCNECGTTIRGVRYKCLHPECPDYDLCSKCEAMPIEVHPALHPLVKMRSPDVVIPTVYRVGGTSLIASPTRQPQTTGVAIATDPPPEKADVAVHTEVKPEMSDAAVATVSPTVNEREAVEHSVVMPVLPTPPPFAPGTASETVQQFSDFWRDEPSRICEANAETEEESTLATADITSLPSFFSAFMAKHPLREKTALHAVFVSDVNVEDGQIFPAGAEFVKCWRIRNDGESAWPETTRVTFVAGDRMPAFDGAPLSYHVGSVETGVTVDVNAFDMKAPEIPGKYVGYWRLSDGTEPFGQSVWCEISVPVPSGPSYIHESLTASEVVMPEPSHARSGSVDRRGEAITPELVPSTSVPATPTVSAPSTDVDSADSLLDEFDTASDEEFWEASREQEGGHAMAHVDTEYIVLYDEQSTDDEGH